jgi:hypothetical protein
MKKHAFGIAALAVGLIALGFAVIPGIALDRPFPFSDEERDRPAAPEHAQEGGVTFKFKKFSVTFGGGKKDDAKEAAQEDKPQQGAAAAQARQRAIDRDHLLKWFTITAVSCSLVGLVLGPVAWAKEKQPAISGPAIGICCVALVWQYIVIGIAIGVTIAVLLILISYFAPW